MSVHSVRVTHTFFGSWNLFSHQKRWERGWCKVGPGAAELAGCNAPGGTGATVLLAAIVAVSDDLPACGNCCSTLPACCCCHSTVLRRLRAPGPFLSESELPLLLLLLLLLLQASEPVIAAWMLNDPAYLACLSTHACRGGDFTRNRNREESKHVRYLVGHRLVGARTDLHTSAHAKG
jgi:hypothetical protein